jgi:Ser/Thr protein kinase RdoA (MazF antagonist)
MKSAPSATSNDARTVVVAAPADSRLPGLARLTDRAHLAAALGRLEPALACAAGEIILETVRYRPAQRHVLRVDVAGPRPRRLFVKIDRDDSGARAVPLATALEAALVPCRDRVGVVAPAGYLVDERAAVWWSVPGPTLSQALVNAPAPPALLRRVAAALRTLHDAAASITEPVVPDHAAAAELTATVRAGEIVAGLAPALGARYHALAADVLAHLPAAPPEAITTIHGDAKGDNVVLDGDRVVFLDLDRMAHADRALDLAKLLADLRWSPAAAGRGPVDAAWMDALVAGYGPVDAECWTRARRLAALLQLKLAARRIPIHEPEWDARMAAEIAAAEHLHAAEVER